MRKHTSIVPVGILFFLASILTFRGFNPAAAAQPGSAAYFSTGQAAYDPQNQAKSQQQAIQSLMEQGLTQAIGSFLSPAQMGAQFDKLEKNILAKPEKYIDSYQVYSENQTDGQFRVLGKVTVSMNLLKQDLVKLGMLGAQNTPPATAAPAPPAGGANGQSAEKPNESQTSAAPPAASEPAEVEQGAAGPASRGIYATKKEVLWAVVEKWDEQWMLPTEGGDTRCLFAQSIAKEMDGFDFSILLPQPGSVEMDIHGNIPPSDAVSLAEKLGVQDVVVGKVSYIVDRQSRQASLEADLRVIRTGQGKPGFELQKTLSMEDLSNHAGALELAKRIAPQLSSMLGGPSAWEAQRGGPGAAASSEHLGPLLIHLPSFQYAYWMELEKILRRQFENMRVESLDIGPSESSVKLDGVDGGYILKMSGTRLPSGAAVRIDSYSTDARTMQISFIPPRKVQAETK